MYRKKQFVKNKRLSLIVKTGKDEDRKRKEHEHTDSDTIDCRGWNISCADVSEQEYFGKAV